MQLLSKMVGGRRAIAAMALVGVLMMAGCAASPSSGSNGTATPAFSVAGGTYNTSQTVTISDTTAAAVLYCTTDGTAPTTSSPVCAEPTTISKTEFLQAMAVAPGGVASSVVGAAYTIDLSAAATPTFSPAGGTYAAGQTVTISDATPGVNLYYTTDGTVPTASTTGSTSMLYTTVPITLSATETISVIAVAPGFSNSGVASALYTIGQGGGQSGGTATPTISPAAGTYSAAQTVSITDATAGATIYYTIDGTAPSSSSTAYSAPITVSQTETIKAIAIASGSGSAVATAAFTIGSGGGGGQDGGIAAPTFSPNGGTFNSTQQVTLTDATPGVDIYYTTSGTAPTENSTAYGGPITLLQSATVEAIAFDHATGSSGPVATAVFTINQSINLPVPTFSPTGGTYSSNQSVTITDSGAAQIFYTLDGSVPSASSTFYAGPITVSASETITAIGTNNGVGSPIGAAIYTISKGQAATPSLSVSTGTFIAAQTETLSDSTPGATIYYTIDGSTPSATNPTATAYTVPFSVSSTTTVNAIATAPSYTASNLATATLTISSGALVLHGTVFSGIAGVTGSLPVNGAQVQLYAAGVVTPTSSQLPGQVYGTGATALLTTPATTDSTGAFTITVNCPAAPGDQVYLLVKGAVMAPDIAKVDADRHLNLGLPAGNFSDEVLRWLLHGNSLLLLLIPFIRTHLRELLKSLFRNQNATFTSPIKAGTSINGPTTPTNASPEFRLNTATATGIRGHDTYSRRFVELLACPGHFTAG